MLYSWKVRLKNEEMRRLTNSSAIFQVEFEQIVDFLLCILSREKISSVKNF